jgi:hypothetical protein
MNLGRAALYLIPIGIGIVFFQNFKSTQPQFNERVVLPSALYVEPVAASSASECRDGDDPVVLVRLVGLRAGEKVSISWQDTENGSAKMQDVTPPFSLGDCPPPNFPNEFFVCPGGKIGYFDLKITSESGDKGYRSGSVPRGCQSEPYVVEAAMQSERR